MIFILKSSSPKGDLIEYRLEDANNNFIGTAVGTGNNDGEFLAMIMIEPAFLNQGFGFQAFEKLYDLINQKYPINKIVGDWNQNSQFASYQNGMSTNLLLFFKNSASMTSKKSALSTPTGKWAIKKGYTKCNVILNTPTHVIVHFTI